MEYFSFITMYLKFISYIPNSVVSWFTTDGVRSNSRSTRLISSADNSSTIHDAYNESDLIHLVNISVISICV